MCISAAIGWAAANASTIGAVAGGVGAAQSMYEGNIARKDARYAAGLAARTEAMATQSANARLKQRRQALRKSSLLADESQTAGAATGRATLGGI